MAEITQPSEIARETLRRLAAKKTPPTPDNYRTLYHEIAGTSVVDVFPEKALKTLAARLPRKKSTQTRFNQQLDGAITAKDWAALGTALTNVLKEFEAEPPAWGALITDLLAQIERRHTDITPAKKREAIEHVLASSGSDPQTLHNRMSSLLRSWTKTPQTTDSTTPTNEVNVEEDLKANTNADRLNESPSIAPDLTPPGRSDSPPNDELRELIAQLVESSLTLLLVDTPDLAADAKAIATDVRQARNAAAFTTIAKRLKQFTYRLHFVAEDQAELKVALQKLLQLVIENITELVDDDKWLNGQIALVLDLFAKPLNVRQLEDVEQRLKDVIYKQSMLKRNLNEAKERLKSMLSGFVDHLASFSETTSDYHDKIERCAVKISAANDLSELNDVIEEVVRETRIIQINAQRSRDDLTAMKTRVADAENEVTRLVNELAQTSEMVRLDQLTGALNRKGMEEAFDRELARTRRRNAPMCIALLDVDNFKRLNDNYGHQVGDEALIHLARVIRETLRPNDTLARYGGEEFLVLLPETGIEDAVKTLTRLQRELTKKFFMHNNEKMLVTFSAGVTALGPEETPKESIAKADAAMYQAKKEGKNRVVIAN